MVQELICCARFHNQPGGAGRIYTGKTSCDSKGKCTTTKPSCAIKSATINIRVINASTGSIAQAFEPFKGSVGNSTATWSSPRVSGSPTQQRLLIHSGSQRDRQSKTTLYWSVSTLQLSLQNHDRSRWNPHCVCQYRKTGRVRGDDVELLRYIKEVDHVRKTERLTTQKIADVTIVFEL